MSGKGSSERKRRKRVRYPEQSQANVEAGVAENGDITAQLTHAPFAGAFQFVNNATEKPISLAKELRGS